MSGQQGRVDIKTSESRHGERVVRQEETVCGDYYDVRGQPFNAVSGIRVFSQRRGLENWKTSFLSELLDWGRGKPSSPAGAAVGLSEYTYHVVARVHKRTEGRDRECGRTHENDT